MKLVLVWVVLSTSYVATQDLDVLLAAIFKNRNVTESRNPDEPKFNLDPWPSGNIFDPVPSTGNCKCVPYYLCNNGNIITDGFDIIDIRIDQTNPGPCGTDYLKTCCSVEDTLINPKAPSRAVEIPDGCGIRNQNGVGFRIKGDKNNESQFAEFPWMVALLREEPVDESEQRLFIYQCGASLIHPKVVLTAAHCVVNHRDTKFKIRAGEWDTQSTIELFAHQESAVEEIIIHEDYNSGSLIFDFALLILSTTVEIAENVDTVCLPKQGTIVGNSRCYATGWGKSSFGKNGTNQVILKKIDLPIVRNNRCQKQLRKTRLGEHFNLNPSFICAGGEKGKGTCKGDGGGPLVCPVPGQRNRYFQAGIVAWGIGCADENVPEVYANVAYVADWINEQLEPFNIDNSYYTY